MKPRIIKSFDEQAKKAIPSKVFFNHFSAIAMHINQSKNRFDLKSNDYFNRLKLKNRTLDLNLVKKLLWNSWSTEYAFKMTGEVDNDDYYKFALHWNFPQAYYTVYLGMTAFHETQNIASDQHEKSIKIFGNSVKDKHYPLPISFSCSGLHEEFEYKRLIKFNGIPDNFNGLSSINCIEDAQNQIASFLKSTRKKNAEVKREKLENAKDPRFFNNSGKFRKTFNKSHWDLIYTTIPETTILNMLYRLRIKANYHDIESFINADINFNRFHQYLSDIVSYLNFVHESYICKVIGKVEYEKVLNGFPKHLNESTANKRYELFEKHNPKTSSKS